MSKYSNNQFKQLNKFKKKIFKSCSTQKNNIVPERMDRYMKVDVKNMSNEQMKDKLMEINIENLKKVDAEKQLENKIKNIKIVQVDPIYRSLYSFQDKVTYLYYRSSKDSDL